MKKEIPKMKEIIAKLIRKNYYQTNFTEEEILYGCWKCGLKKVRTKEQLTSDCKICKDGGTIICFYNGKHDAKLGS